MRIEIKYNSSVAPHIMDLSEDELNEIRSSDEIFVSQKYPAVKTFKISGSPVELELLGISLLERARAIRRRIAHVTRSKQARRAPLKPISWNSKQAAK